VGNSAFADGTNDAALFDTPVGICVDVNSNLYIADTGNSVIRKLTPTTNGWVSSTIAGLAGYPGNADGTNSQARFDYPSGVTVDANGNLYVADQVNSTVRKMTTNGTNWTVSTIAGLAGNYGSANGTNGVARFYYPAGVAVDTAGNVYVADQINSTIRKLTPLASNNWAVTTIAGTAGLNGSTDGTNNTSRFYWPSDLTVDASGNLFVADTFNNTIRKVSPIGTNYVTTTICGVAGVNNSVDGTNNTALFDGLGGIALDAFGNLFVVDSYSSVIRKITPVGTNWVVNTVGGLAYVTGATDGTNSTARFNTPYGICVDGNGLVYIADTYNQTIRAGSTLYSLPAKPNVLIVLAGKNFAFNWQAQAGLTYQVQFKTNLLQAAWFNLGSSILATNTVMPFVDTSATNDQRFYRVMVMP
jgi:streptogramin lyase